MCRARLRQRGTQRDRNAAHRAVRLCIAIPCQTLAHDILGNGEGEAPRHEEANELWVGILPRHGLALDKLTRPLRGTLVAKELIWPTGYVLNGDAPARKLALDAHRAPPSTDLGTHEVLGKPRIIHDTRGNATLHRAARAVPREALANEPVSGLLLRVIPARHKVNELGPRAFIRERPHLVQKLGPAARLRDIRSVKSPGYANGDENGLGICRLYTCQGLSRPDRGGTSIGEAERPRKARGTLVHTRVPRSLVAGRSGSPTRHRSQRSPESRAPRPQGAPGRRPHGRETRSRP